MEISAGPAAVGQRVEHVLEEHAASEAPLCARWVLRLLKSAAFWGFFLGGGSWGDGFRCIAVMQDV